MTEILIVLGFLFCIFEIGCLIDFIITKNKFVFLIPLIAIIGGSLWFGIFYLGFYIMFIILPSILNTLFPA